MELFKGQSLLEFTERFKTDLVIMGRIFLINRSQNKDTIFNKLMKRIVERSPVSQSQLVCS